MRNLNYLKWVYHRLELILSIFFFILLGTGCNKSKPAVYYQEDGLIPQFANTEIRTRTIFDTISSVHLGKLTMPTKSWTWTPQTPTISFKKALPADTLITIKGERTRPYRWILEHSIVPNKLAVFINDKQAKEKVDYKVDFDKGHITFLNIDDCKNDSSYYIYYQTNLMDKIIKQNVSYEQENNYLNKIEKLFN